MKFYQTFVIVSIEFWVPNSSHKICNNTFIHHCQGWVEGSFVCETVLIFFLGEYSSVWPEIFRVLSQIQSRFVPRISEKNYFGIIFQKFCANHGYPLLKLVKFRPTFCNFILGPYCVEKIHTSTFIRCLHLGKEADP